MTEQVSHSTDGQVDPFMNQPQELRRGDWTRVFVIGDNLPWLHGMPSDSVDVVYLDPPFNSRETYNSFFFHVGDDRVSGQKQAFEDTWVWEDGGGVARGKREYGDFIKTPGLGVETLKAFYTLLGPGPELAYLTFMVPRLAELHRVLKPTGSLWLHCDSTAGDYLGVALRVIFGREQLRNEVIWKRTSAHNDARRRMARVHDVLWCYGKTSRMAWYPDKARHAYTLEYVQRNYRHADPDGRRWTASDACASAGLTGGGSTYEWHGHTKRWIAPRTTMERWAAEGRLVYTGNGLARYKRYLDEGKGPALTGCWDDIAPLTDYWDDIKVLGSHEKERMQYPTQKPVRLLARILEVSSKRGDVVLDPFAGCGTTIEAAETLGRQWIGVDISFHAKGHVLGRRPLEAIREDVKVVYNPTTPAEAAALFKESPLKFEDWILELVGARSRGEAPVRTTGTKGSGGADGVMWFEEGSGDSPKVVVISVKGGATVHPHQVRELTGTKIRTETTKVIKPDMFLFLSQTPPTKGMEAHADDEGRLEVDGVPYDRVQFLTTDDLLVKKKRFKRPPHWKNRTFDRRS